MKKEIAPGRKLRKGGILTVIISLVAGIVFVITIGRSCGFVGGVGLIAFLLLGLIGIIAFISGLVIEKRERTIEK